MGKLRVAGDRGERGDGALGIAGLGPGGEQVADVGERVADRRQLPVEDRAQPVTRVHDVAEAVVAVHEGRGPGLRAVLGQPGRHFVQRGDLARGVVLPEAAEAPQLALEVARRLAVALQAAGAPVDVVDLDQRVDQLLADPLRLEAVRQRVGQHVALDQLHDVERDAEQRVVVAGREDLRDAHVGALERAQQERLAQDVVRGGRQRWARRAPQHPLAAVAPDQVGDVGVPVADLFGLQLTAVRGRARRGTPPAGGGSAAAGGRVRPPPPGYRRSRTSFPRS